MPSHLLYVHALNWYAFEHSTLLVKLSFARKRLIISSERDVVIDEVPAHGAYQPTLCTQGRYDDRSNSLADPARVSRCSKADQGLGHVRKGGVKAHSWVGMAGKVGLHRCIHACGACMESLTTTDTP